MQNHIGTLRHRTVTVNPPVTGGVLQIGSGSTRVYNLILNGSDQYGKSAVIWTAAEVGAPKTITAVSLYFRSYSTPRSFPNQVIKLAMVDQATFNSSPDMSFGDLNLTGFITAKAAFTFNLPNNNAWYQFTLDTPFVYDGVKNLMLVWENNWGTYQGDSGGNDGSSIANTVITKASATAPVTGIGTRLSNRPNIKIHY
jgi:hypothetical protein